MSRHTPDLALAFSLFFAAGCTGSVLGDGDEKCSNCADPGAGAPPGAGPGAGGPSTGGPDTGEPPGVEGVGWTTRFPRLSHAQWEHTVRDLLRLDTEPGLSNTFSLDPDDARFDNYAVRIVSANLWSDYQRAAEQLAADVARDPVKLARLQPAAAPNDATAFVSELGTRAYRRPLAQTEIDGLVALFNQGAELLASGDAYADGAELVLRALLQSPHFLYRVESSAAATGDKIWLNPYEVASRLSYALWNTMPAGELTAEGAAAVRALPATVPTRKRYELVLSGGPLALSFAPPDAGDRGRFAFALLSDVQEAIDDVQDIYAKLNAEPDLSFLFGAGDLTERGSREELERFQRELLTLEIPYYTTLGNHELGESPPLYHDYFGRGSFSFLYRGVQFTPIDTASATLDPVVYEWLDRWLAQGRDRVHVLSMHIAPIDPTGVRNGSFGSRGEASMLLAKLAEARVDLTLYGHVHSHYAFENAGIPAFISGGGGAVPERFDGIGRHFMVFEISAEDGVLSSKVVRVD